MKKFLRILDNLFWYLFWLCALGEIVLRVTGTAIQVVHILDYFMGISIVVSLLIEWAQRRGTRRK
jgi:hypothetical protein